MNETSMSVQKKVFYASVFVCAVLALLLTTVWPLSVVGAEGEDGHLPDPAPASDFLEESGGSRPYYSPEVAASFDPGAESLQEKVADRVPAELLPESLLPEEDVGAKPGGGDFSAAGAGGWTPLVRPYTPSPDPDIAYWASSGQLMDNSGRIHAIYEMAVWTDVSQPLDPPHDELLSDVYYAMFYGGSWTTPIDLTGTTGFEDVAPVFMNVDSAGYIHLVYSKWTWGIDPNTLIYQHEEENLWYRYMSPDGNWSPPRQLTNFIGNWGLLGADFWMSNDRLFGTFVIIRNNETAPIASYRVQVGYLEGFMETWETMVQLSAWNFTMSAGQEIPNSWPGIAVSWLGGEIAVMYGVQTIGAAVTDSRSDIYVAIRDTGGTWSAPQNITSAAANQFWLPFFMFYKRNANRLMVFSHQVVNFTGDAAHPHRNNVQLIYHDAGGWEAPLNITRVSNQQDGFIYDMWMDPFQNLHFTLNVIHYAWIGGAWRQQGGSLEYTREVEGGFSGIATILGYMFQRYVADSELIVDGDGNIRILFTSFMYDGGVNRWGWNVNYIDNAPTGDPLVFNAVEQIRPSTNYEVYWLEMSGFPDGDIMASWVEKGFDAALTPTWGRMFSRYRDGTTWRETVPVSEVPGSADILHVTPGGWFEDIESADNGEQRCVFETAKYDVPTTTYYDFRKYFTETVNGVWTTPELISDAAVSGERPALYADGGQRYYVLYSTMYAVNKWVIHATQQREPTAPAATYFFAEGTTRPGFEEWICIQNSGEEQANVTITYMLETGENINQVLPVPAHTRSTVNVNAAISGEHDVSARVTADRFIVAERPMYFDYRGCTGGHCVMGALDTSRVWYFAEGTTRGGFDEYLTLQNPSEMATHVNITYVLGDGTTVPGGIDIGARSRATVNVNEVIGPGRDVSLVVESDRAIVAERPMYFNYYGITGGHCEMGSTSLATRWYFAEGTTRGGFDTYICLQNPYNVDAVADLTFILGDGSTVGQPFLVPATSRQTLRINDAVGDGQDVSTVVESDSLLLAERPMYFLYNGAWPGGHVVTGVREPKNTWFFAEGTTRGGFDEWLCLENPGDADTVATMSFMLEDGTVMPADVAVPAHTRVTVGIWPIVGGGHDVSVVVSSDRAIVVERPMYFIYGGAWPGGHVVVGL